MKINTMKDIAEVSQRIIERFVSDHSLSPRIAEFNLLVDHGDGSLSNASFNPCAIMSPSNRFIAVDDYSKLLILVHSHICPLKDECSFSAQEESWKYHHVISYSDRNPPPSYLLTTREEDARLAKATLNCPLRKLLK